eukprot:gnl/Chilomastix_cuspidata/1805.p1 GENE.gnl/Chilomastix_cuspidata/1805~~gnl/Chilomastix_cuspidata/1805.p1  ORF type:complete len:520 (+),score=257.46 gnl/Chilomastix_cuspidata/1805:311-1870(+)
MINAKRSIQRIASKESSVVEKKALPKLDTFLEERDFAGAITLLKFVEKHGIKDQVSDGKMWLGYCYFHSAQHEKALEIYQELLREHPEDTNLHLFTGICYFYLGEYEKAKMAASRGTPGGLRNRLLFQLAHRFNDDEALLEHHQQLEDCIEDQLSLAAVHYLRTHYKQAIETYEQMLETYEEYIILHAYIALAYYRMDYCDKCLDIIQQVSMRTGESLTTVNLKACALYRLQGSEMALAALNKLFEEHPRIRAHPILKHNECVFSGAEKALHVLPTLLDVIPKARYNLVTFLLRRGEALKAWDYMRDFEPADPTELILKGITAATYGQKTDDREALALAEEIFQMVGASKTEKDTIPGRQSMASCYILQNKFGEAIRYLETIKDYSQEDEEFCWNLGISLAAAGKFRPAIAELRKIRSDKYRASYVYRMWLARCFIRTDEPEKAYEIYAKTRKPQTQSDLLQLIANECYALGHWEFAAKAFEVLLKMDPAQDFKDGLLAARAAMELESRGEAVPTGGAD